MSARRKPPTSSSLQPDETSNGNLTTQPPQPSATPPPNPSSALLPTRLEAGLLSIYPATLLLGSLFSSISPLTRNTPYNPTLQSHPPAVAPSYFAQKRNVFNLYFVKIGWFWTSLALLLFAFTHPSLGPPLRPVLTARRLQAAARYALTTLAWAAVTQWFFGPPLIDRSFRFTGGQCELLDDAAVRAAMSPPREVLTHAACKVAGGRWAGGHDISGHVFLLILGSAMLWMEVLPTMLKASGLREERRVAMADGKVRSVAAEGQAEVREVKEMKGGDKEVTALGVKVALGVTALSWWMLLMTAAFFHTWFEKFTGLVVALASVWAVYFLPRGVPALRAVVGMPGV